jgi:hypothetical protein
MDRGDKHVSRQAKSHAFAVFARLIKQTFERRMATATNIFDCVSRARLSEKNAVGAQRSLDLFRRESPQADPPPELSNEAIAKYYLEAVRLYEGAATYAVLQNDLYRAHRYFRRAAACGDCYNAIVPGRHAEIVAAKDNREKATLVRYEAARRSMPRRWLTLGLRRKRW